MNQAPFPSAHLGWRAAAAVYDLLPLLAILFATGAIAQAVTGGTLDPHALLFRLALLAVIVAYYAVSWRRGGQTIGMRAWRLRVTRADGGPLDWSTCLLRFAVSLVSTAAVGLGFLWCLVDRDRRAWHDIAAGTRVVRLPKNG
ncbi:RDD family protein [Tahibacter amnicola]|uniref:RDD family protein n=1 Tax=Tahibacter amnicola TaxID=2976241 RepID=A0ABY6BCZ7_9GAMM|nr:RDD family protein [Tahibacter amnicola]UXI67911.1 RDD family protein [Tahibacter amnicola]